MPDLPVVLHVNDRKAAASGAIEQPRDALDGPLQGCLRLGPPLSLRMLRCTSMTRSAVSGPAMRPAFRPLCHRLAERVGEEAVLRLGVVEMR